MSKVEIDNEICKEIYKDVKDTIQSTSQSVSQYERICKYTEMFVEYVDNNNLYELHFYLKNKMIPTDDLIKNNRRVTASGLVKIQFKCKTCNKIHSKTDK